MHRAALLLLSLLLAAPAHAGDAPIVDRQTRIALQQALRTDRTMLADLATVDRRLGAVAPDPLAGQVLDDPLAGLDTAWALAAQVASDAPLRQGTHWDGAFGALASAWGVSGEAKDPCSGGASPALSTQHVAAAASRGEKLSNREVKDFAIRLSPEIDSAVGSLAGAARLAACRVDAALGGIAAEDRDQLLTLAVDLLERRDLEPGPLADAFSQVDLPLLLRAARDWTDAVEAAADALHGTDAARWPTSPQIWQIDLGEVWIGSPGPNSGTGNPVLIVDPGGDDHWRIHADGPVSQRAVAGWIDLGGDDVWRSGSGGTGAVFGVAAGVDLAGHDTHAGKDFGAGGALFGIATWDDRGGDDSYTHAWASQGFGLLGAGMLRDLDGDDVYDLRGAGQGAGFPRGVGILHDARGDDRYLLTVGDGAPCAGGCGQGAGIGDELRFPGGVGLLVDDSGDDAYVAEQNAIAFGSGYGLGVLRDGGGDDRYESAERGVAAGEAGSGLLIDAAGRDRYVSGQGPGSTSVDGVAVVLDRARDDVFVGDTHPTNRGTALLLSEGTGFELPEAHEGSITARSAIREAAVPESEPSSHLPVVGMTSSGRNPTAADFVAKAWPDRDALNRANWQADSLDFTDAARRAIADAVRDAITGSSGDDPTNAWRLGWLGSLAQDDPLLAGHVETAAAASIDHPHWRVRAAAWDARASLASITDLELPPEEAERLATAAAVALQREESYAVRAAAARVAGAFGEAGVASTLTKALRAPHRGLRHAAEEALLAVCSRTDGVAVARGLYPIAEGEAGVDPVQRDAALRVLGATGQRDARAFLIETLADDDPATALAAALGLARDDHRDAVRALDAWRETADASALDALEAVAPTPAD